MIERAYELDARAGLAVWCQDEAGPFQAVPHPGGSWRPQGQPATRPHEYVRGGTLKDPNANPRWRYLIGWPRAD